MRPGGPLVPQPCPSKGNIETDIRVLHTATSKEKLLVWPLDLQQKAAGIVVTLAVPVCAAWCWWGYSLHKWTMEMANEQERILAEEVEAEKEALQAFDKNSIFNKEWAERQKVSSRAW